MKLKLKWITIFFLAVCLMCGSASALTQNGSISDGVLTLNNHVFTVNVSTTSEQHGGYKQQSAKEYYEHTWKYSDTVGNSKPGYSDYTCSFSKPVLYIEYGSCYMPPISQYSTSRDTYQYDLWVDGYYRDDNGDYRVENTMTDGVLVPVGYITDIPRGYYGVTHSKQIISSPRYTGITVNSDSTHYALDPWTFNGKLKSVVYTPVNRTDYTLSRPVTAVPTDINTLSIPTEGQSRYGTYFAHSDSTWEPNNRDYWYWYSTWRAGNGTPHVYEKTGWVGTTRPTLQSSVYTARDVRDAQQLKDQGYVYVQATKTGGGDLVYRQREHYAVSGYGYDIYPITDYWGIACVDPGGQGGTQLFHDISNYQTTYTNVSVKDGQAYAEVHLTNCISNQGLTTTVPVEISGGQYTGAPALNSSNFVVHKGTITDTSGKSSTFLQGPDSESTIVKDGTTTITTVKLSNPPVIIDWADFPGQIADTLKDLRSTS